MRTKKIRILFLIFVGLGAAVFTGGNIVGKTVVKSFKTEKNNVIKIQNILENLCDCERIKKDIYAKGVQYSNEEGFTTEKVDFALTNCKYENLKEEGERIAKSLNEEGLKSFDLITLDFISDEKQETIIIKNGKIQ